MTNTAQKTIGVFLPEGFADWEYGLLAAGAAEHLGARIVYITQDAGPVRSIGGLAAAGQRAAAAETNRDLDALALIGSDAWNAPNPPDVTDLVKSMLDRGGVVGGICAATVGMARAGILDGRRHTSNGRGWIVSMTGGYAGSDGYVETPSAVTDGMLVTAPGTAPVAFAAAFLTALYPDAAAMMSGVRTMFAAEHGS